MKLTIGLFGTCGGSQWRKPFADRYTQEGISFFDPQKPDWKPEDATIEAEHLAEDAIILFPVTGETTGAGSLSEVGFSILNAIRLDNQRDFVILIEPTLSQNLMDTLPPVHAKESLRARALVIQHLKKLRLSNLYLVSSLEEMLEVSVQLHKAAAIRVPLQALNPHAEKPKVAVPA